MINHEPLSVALDACLVTSALCDYAHDRVHRCADKASAVIEETLRILRWYKKDHSGHLYDGLEFFDSYEKQKMLLHVFEREDWPTWESDLEQWLLNQRRVLDFFSKLQGYANSRCHSGRCF